MQELVVVDHGQQAVAIPPLPDVLAESLIIIVPTSTSSFEYEITITYGTHFVVEVVVFLLKFNVAYNSSSNSLLIYSGSKFLISSIIGVREASSFT
jgi:hypothetical protein